MEDISIGEAWKRMKGRQRLKELIRWTYSPTCVEDLRHILEPIPVAVLYDGIRMGGAAAAICWVEYGRRRGFTTGTYEEARIQGNTFCFDASSPALTETPVYRS